MVIRKIYVPPTVEKKDEPSSVLVPNLEPPSSSVLLPNVDPPSSSVLLPNEEPPSSSVLLPNVEETPGAAYQLPEDSTPEGDALVFADVVELDLAPGKIIGRRRALPDGSECFSYQGIPYAHPPVGELRFKPPVPLEEFDEQPLQCGQERGICVAPFYLPPTNAAGSEDCLYLNVYTSSGPGQTDDPPMPVMVWIHGGGFYTGSGNSDFFGPDYLLQHGVILVTLNYRLGPLGFLALPSLGIHGNQGLKDQQLALRWVHENIAQFGGDPSNVTLFGESAGGASVTWQYLCPTSRQYFQKAIAQSGTSLCPWTVQYEPEQKARKLASVLGYTGEDDACVLETLLNASFDELVSNAANAFEDSEKTIYLVTPFIPSVEDDSSKDAIITQRPDVMMRQSYDTNIPLMHGVTNAEGLVFYGPLETRFDELVGNLAMTLPLEIGVPKDFVPAVLEEMRQFYFGDRRIDQDRDRFFDLLADAAFNFPIYATAELHARYQPEAPQYFYRFSYETQLNQAAKLLGVPEGVPGACHADELPYLFSGSLFSAQVESGSREDRARSLLCRLWTNFAKFGNPTPAEDEPGVGFHWEPVASAGEPFVLRALDLNDQVDVVEDLYHDRIQFWKSLVERFNPTLLGAE